MVSVGQMSFPGNRYLLTILPATPYARRVLPTKANGYVPSCAHATFTLGVESISSWCCHVPTPPPLR